jgi:hypothetical protein
MPRHDAPTRDERSGQPEQAPAVTRRALGALAAAALLIVACPGPREKAGGGAASTSPSLTSSAPSEGFASSPPSGAPGPASAPEAPPSHCVKRPGTVSDDDAPTVRGARAEIEVLPWFAARGVAKNSVLAWFAARQGDRTGVEESAESFSCRPLQVGAPAEEALFCEYWVRNDLMLHRGALLVARGGRPTALLDVGLGVQAMDFPEARWLDLAITFAPDGLSAELADRAPEGSTLVEAPSRCVERERQADECEAKLAAADPSAEIKLDGCPLVRGPDGKYHIARVTPSMMTTMGYPATLHGCAAARANLRSSAADLASSPAPLRAGFKSAIAFADKSCAQRGRWSWQGGRFAQEKK